MRSLLPSAPVRIGASAVALSLLALAGCSTSPPLSYFVLAPSMPADVAPRPIERRMVVGLQPVDLADYLDRPEIVTRSGDTTIRLSALERWGEQLDVQVGRVIVQNVAAMVPGLDVFLLPTSFVVSPERELVIEILRFDADAEGTVHLDARWQVSVPAETRVILERRTVLSEPVAGGTPSSESGRTGRAQDRGYAEVAAAMSRALGRLSAEIATALR